MSYSDLYVYKLFKPDWLLQKIVELAVPDNVFEVPA